ncbi:TPA: HIT domain-containing protein, partial [Streptococcus pneumoniae]
MSDCIFCKIIAGEIPASKVYEDEQVLAFLDISQVTLGHTLVVPKEHYRNLLEMDA